MTLAKWSLEKMSSFKDMKILLRHLATKQPGMGKCLAAGSSEMQPLSCCKFIQIRALVMIALANEWMAEYKGVSNICMVQLPVPNKILGG